MTKKATLVDKLLAPVNPAAAIIMAVYTFLWGLWMMIPWWDTFSVAHHYDYMAGLAHEWAWGLGAVIIGVVMIYGVIKGSDESLIRGSVAGYLWWTFIAILEAIGAIHGVSWLTCAMVAVYCGYIALNLRVNRKKQTRL